MNRLLIALVTLMLVTGCNEKSSEGVSVDPVTLRVRLVDAPNEDLKNVYVNIDHIEMHTTKGGKESRIIFGEDIGLLDLLTLRDGVYLPMEEMELPADTQIKQIRMVLKDTDNFIIHSDDSRCDLKTPSAQQAGLKILISENIPLETGHDYNLTIDFDALKSVVIQPNGDCLLKPVLKIHSLVKLIEDSPTDEGEAVIDNSTDEDVPADELAVVTE